MSALEPIDSPASTEEGLMSRYGITRVPVDYYHFREFRYTSLADALAQAQQKTGPLPSMPLL